MTDIKKLPDTHTESHGAELHIVNITMYLTFFAQTNYMLARIVIWLCTSCGSTLIRSVLLLCYIVSYAYFGFMLFMHSLEYLKAMYWTNYKWQGPEQLIKERTVVQVSAWIIISITIYITLKVLLYGLVSYVKENSSEVRDMFFKRLYSYNPFEVETEECQRMNCGFSLYECEECIRIDDKYYFHLECAKVELVQNNYKRLYSQKYNEYIVVEPQV